MKYCIKCGVQIDPERLEALPHTTTCTPCSTEGPRHDPNIVCDKASPSGQNGFAPKS